MINRRVSLFYQYPLEVSHPMVCPYTLWSACVACPGTGELGGQQFIIGPRSRKNAILVAFVQHTNSEKSVHITWLIQVRYFVVATVVTMLLVILTAKQISPLHHSQEGILSAKVTHLCL